MYNIIDSFSTWSMNFDGALAVCMKPYAVTLLGDDDDSDVSVVFFKVSFMFAYSTAC
jgi:hypothetical protein